MAILAVDEVMLREPRLLVPRMAPLNSVRLADKAPTGFVTPITIVGAANGGFTKVGAPANVGRPGGRGYYFGSGNYFLFQNLMPGGGGAGSELNQCFVEVAVFDVTSLSATTTAIVSEGASPTDGDTPYLLQMNSTTLRVYWEAGYNTILSPAMGTVVCVVRTYSDFSPYPWGIFVNGVKALSRTRYRSTLYAKEYIYVGSGYNSQFTAGNLFFYGLWRGRLINDVQAAELSCDPYSLMLPA